MSVMMTGHWGRALEPGVNAWYGDTYKEYPQFYKDMFDVEKSTKHREEDVGIFSFGLAHVKAEGAPVNYDSEQQGFVARYTHVEYALGFVISKILVEDDLYDKVGMRRAQSLAFSMRQTKEVVAALVYNRAVTSGYTGPDGKVLLATDHLLGKGGTFSNKPSTDLDLSEATLEQATIDIMGFQDDAGKKIMAMPQDLIIPPASFAIAHRILNSTLRGGTANNDANVLKDKNLIKRVIVNPFLTDSDSWFLRTNVPHGMKFFERRADEFSMSPDFDTDNAKFKATMRFSAGWTDPRGIYGSMGG